MSGVDALMGIRFYSPTEIDQALAAVIVTGSAREAAKQLKANGLPISDRTLRGWRHKHAERFAQLENQLAPVLAERVASRAEQIALRSLEVQETLIERTAKDAENLNGEKAASAARNLAVVSGISFDKLSGPVRQRPTIVEHRHSAGDLLSKLAERIGQVIDSTAVELDAPLLDVGGFERDEEPA